MAGEPKPIGSQSGSRRPQIRRARLGRVLAVKRSRAREKTAQNMRTTLEEMESRRSKLQWNAEAKETPKSFTYLVRETLRWNQLVRLSGFALPWHFCLAIESIQSLSMQAGDKLGPYEIVAPIGAGGMGNAI